MRGRKTDSEFLSDFISNCTQRGMETPMEIAGHARKMIQDIDEEIKRVEKQKLTRAKLLDVIQALDKPVKSSKLEEVRALSFFKIQRSTVCKFICDTLKNAPSTIDGLISTHPKEDIMFCIKQLIEHKVICKANNMFLRGEMFDEYLKFVLRET